MYVYIYIYIYMIFKGLAPNPGYTRRARPCAMGGALCCKDSPMGYQ